MSYQGATTIATFGAVMEHQVHRESAGGPLAMRILRSLTDIRGHRVLFVNDCLPVVQAMRKGSRSSQLQSDAEYMALASLEAGCKSLYLHVPGTDMIEQGVDGAGRDGARRIVGPACTEQARAKIRSVLAQHGWRITIDLFAAACNRFTARYASWTDEPESEAVDAFTVPSWDQSMCSCGRIHRETAFFFPPRGLEKAVVRRAKSDGVKAAFLVPTSCKAGYWEALRGRAVAQLQLDEPALTSQTRRHPWGHTPCSWRTSARLIMLRRRAGRSVKYEDVGSLWGLSSWRSWPESKPSCGDWRRRRASDSKQRKLRPRRRRQRLRPTICQRRVEGRQRTAKFRTGGLPPTNIGTVQRQRLPLICSTASRRWH